MTLADIITQPIDLATARTLALVFDAELAQTLQTVQQTYGDPRHVPAPTLLTDGRYMLCADLLTEIGAHGLYAPGFSHLPQELFASVSVIPMAEAVALLPQPDLQ